MDPLLLIKVCIVEFLFARKNDWKEIEDLINSVKPTDSESKTEFLDFVSNNGFIEHFHVTSDMNIIMMLIM